MFAADPTLGRRMRAAHDSVSGLFAGRYLIEREVGEGATAIVHLARDTHAGISVALKVLRPELAESGAAARFLNEIERTSRLDHPRILRVLHAGEHEGRPYFALPYMEGGSLRSRIRRETQLGFADVIAVARSVATALDYAHGQGLVHRDVKPENILFTAGEACLGDFGISRALEAVYGDASSSAHIIRGTPAYMSPEQAAGERNLDGRSDQYGLACVVYEMITGMQAFMGPTPESVIAQRFAHGPRPLRVYRPSVPPDVEAVVEKALSIPAADRFESATALVDALDLAFTSTNASVVDATPPAAAAQWRTGGRTAATALTGMIGFVAAVTLAVKTCAPVAGPDVPLDTSRIAILPLERDPGNAPLWRDEDLLQQAMTRWSDVDVVDHFQVADAVRRHGRIGTERDASTVAASVGAARYVRGRLSALGDGWLISASLYDVASPRALHTASANIPPHVEEAVRSYERLSEVLLLRGEGEEDPTPGVIATRSLNALRAFSEGQRALEEWDLIAADSAFQAALGFDPSFGRASFWLAQVRAWQEQGSSSWSALAERAIALDGLAERERLLAQALSHLGKGKYASACSIYERLVARSRLDFPGWLGLGQCEMMNKLVQPDAKSPSGWSFLANTQRGMRAYLTAFEILPSVYGRYREGSFQRLRRLLFLSNQSVVGFGAADSAIFLARPALIADSLVLVPYPAAVFVQQGPTPAGFTEAIARQRKEFRRVAALWSVAFPKNAGVKEAVALALEVSGEPAAIDTLREARSLATDTAHADRLAATEAILLFKFGLEQASPLIGAAAYLADSILNAERQWTAGRARTIAPIAAMTGRCALSGRILAETGLEFPSREFSSALFAESQVALVRGLLGCDSQDSGALSSVRSLAAHIDAETRTRGLPDTRTNDGRFLLRPSLLTTPYDTVLLRRVLASTEHPVVAAVLQGAAGDTARATVALNEFESRWNGDMATPDFVVATAMARLALGDTAAATRALDKMLSSLPAYESEVFKDAPRMAAFVRGMVMRAELAVRAGDMNAARRWSEPLTALWKSSDSPLRARAAVFPYSAGKQ